MKRRQTDCLSHGLILIVDVGYIAWGAMAAAGRRITCSARVVRRSCRPVTRATPAGSWSELAGTSPMTAGYMKVLFRMYGVYNVAFGLMAIAIAVTAFRRGERWAWWALLVGNTIASVSAMTYDRTVNAIGPFELTEYLGLALVWGALAVTAPFRAAEAASSGDGLTRLPAESVD